MNSDANMIASWVATLLDGTELTSEEAKTFERVTERGGCRRLAVDVNGRTVHASCSPEHGESLRLFTRRGIIDAMSPNARQVNMPVIEVRRVDGAFTRLYVHPEHGIVLSTLDLNL